MSQLAALLDGTMNMAGSDGAGPPCVLHAHMAGLDDEDRAAVNAALTDPHPTQVGRYRVPTDKLAAMLSRAGLPVSDKTIARHRRGYCGCPRG